MNFRRKSKIIALTLAGVLLSTAVYASCKNARNCEEAVKMWCDGFKRADGDKDGIPCENVCKSVEQLNKIRERIGC